MKTKIYLYYSLLLFGFNLYAQVVINGNPNSTSLEAHPSAMLQIKNQNEAAAKAMGLPVVADAKLLPKYNASQPDLYDDDPTMEGMLMYQTDESVVKVYDGTKWSNAFSVEKPNLTRARVGSNISIPSSGGNLNFTQFNDKPNGFIDYLNLKTGVTAPNVFKIRQTGVYRVNVTAEVNLSSTNLLTTAFVNNNYRFALKFPIGNSGSTRIANYEFTMMLKQGEEIRFEVSSENSSSFTVFASNLSTILIEKIM